MSERSDKEKSAEALTRAGVFKGADGLARLAHAVDFWSEKPYGTRLYFGDGGGDYLHRDVVQTAVRLLADGQARADLAAERERELLKQAADCVPTNWLDPLLTGPSAVNLKGADGRQVEALLRGIQDRIRALATHEHNEGES